MSTEINPPVNESNLAPPSGLPSPAPAALPPSAPAGKVLTNLARRLDWRLAGLIILGAVSIPIWHALKTHAKTTPTESVALPPLTVPIGRVTREDLFATVPFVAEFRPYEEVELHAKVSGYVNDMKVDFGDHVKAGQLLATLEVPELQAQLTNAMAVERRAEAEYKAAHLNYTRLAKTAKDTPGSVAPQDVDTAEAKDGTADAAIAAAKAEVDRYHTLLGYTRITAPFDGVVTHRYVDPGTLIQAGTASDTQSLPVVRVSDNYRLRLDFPVEVKYVKDVHLGDEVDVLVESLGNKKLKGVITRASYKVNEATRTMTTEIEVPNPNLELVPGMYATVILKLQRHQNALAIPIEAIPPGQTTTVYIVNDRDEIEERPVSLGLDTPTKYEVLSGLKEGERVLVGSRSIVKPGQKVEAKLGNTWAQD